MAKFRPRPLEVRPEYETLYQRIAPSLQVLVVLAALATVPVIIAQERGDTDHWIVVVDWVIWWVFLAEVLLGTLCASRRGRYLTKNWLGLVIVVLSFPALPDLLAGVRLVRVARLLRLARLARIVAVTYRGMRTLQHSTGGQSLIFLGGLTALFTGAGGVLLTFIEPQTAPGGVLDGLWWAAVTVSTVGYGDITPATPLGRLLAIVLMLCGLGLVSTLAAAISASFIGADSEPDHDDLNKRLQRLEDKMDRLLAAQERSGAAE